MGDNNSRGVFFSFVFSFGRIMRLKIEWNWSGPEVNDEFGIQLGL